MPIVMGWAYIMGQSVCAGSPPEIWRQGTPLMAVWLHAQCCIEDTRGHGDHCRVCMTGSPGPVRHQAAGCRGEDPA